MKNNSLMITKGQISKIYVLANDIGIDNESLHDLVKAMFKKF